MEDEETLQSTAVVRQFANTIKHIVNDLLANGIMTTGVVVGGILLASDQLLRVKEALVGALANFNVSVLKINRKNIQKNKLTRINDRWLEIDHDGTGHVLTGASRREEGRERVVLLGNGTLLDLHTDRLNDAEIQVKSLTTPSGVMPCSKQYSSQQALPIWTPAWPT